MEPVASACGVLIEVRVVNAGRPWAECPLDNLHVGIDLGSGGCVRGDADGVHGEFGVEVAHRACVGGSLGNGTTEMA